MMVQETLKSIPRNKMLSLDSRRVFLPWQASYEALKIAIKGAGVKDWRQQVLKIAKESLKLTQDSEACIYLTELREFETYIQNEYVIGINMVTDLFSKLFAQPRAKDIVDSVKKTTEALNILRTIKSKKLWPKFTEEMLEKIVQRCLLRRDGAEFGTEWAKERARSMMANEVPEASDEDDDMGIDLNRTIADEISKGSLEAKKDFLVRFLKRKLLELGQKQATARTLGEDRSPERRKKSVKFKRGDKIFRMKEIDPGECSSDEDEVEGLIDDFETLFVMNEDDRPKKTKKTKSSVSKKCPIRCPKVEHVNGSLYFCNVFRRKEKEEMQALVTKLHLCLKCLSPQGKEHKCPVGKCRRCGAAHNILLCTKEPDDKSMVGKEQNETSEEDSEDEAYDDFTNNRDNVNLAKDKTEVKKEKPVKKDGKKGKGEADEEITPESSEEEKKKRLEKLRQVLANISAGYETGRKESCEKKNQTSILKTQERVCLVRTEEMNRESGSDESQEAEVSDNKTESSDNESEVERKVSIAEESNESTCDQEEEIFPPREVKPDQCTLDDSEPEGAIAASDEETTSEEWTTDSDGSGYERAYFISSAANIRRREIHGQPRYTEKISEEGRKKKLKTVKERSDQASLKDLQEEVQKGITKDDRGIKAKNQKRSVNSIDKWQASEIWNEIVAEGEDRITDMMESIHLLHIPNTTPMEPKEPEPPPGYKRLRFEPKKGGRVFKELLSLSTQLFERVALKGKNLASMTTPLTVCADEEGAVDSTLAALNGIEVHTVNGKTLLETCGITDTGADTNCADRTLRKVMGRDPLPDAAVGIQGSTGVSKDKSKDRLRLVTSDNEITVMESRSINDLGYSGPNSKEFLESIKVELDVTEKNEDHFDLNTQGAIPRVLIGLKSGQLLASQLSEEARISLDLDEAFLSPNMQIWRTPLNSKLLITGSLGLDPQLIELKNNYPRFNILVKDSENEEDVLEKIRKKKEKLEKIFEEEFEADSDKLFISLLESEEKCKVKVNIPANSPSENESESSDHYEAVNKKSEESYQPGVEEGDTRSEEIDQECEECIITKENFSFPQSILVQCSTDKILVLPEEILVLLDDYLGDKHTFPMDLVLVPKHSDTIRLHMENNLIQNLSRAVDQYYKTSNNNYKYITHLYLSNNNIDSFHQECLPPDLKELFLDNNRLETFKQTDINYFDSLVNRTKLDLKLGNNLYECNCESRALYHFVKNRGSKIRDLDQVKLQCEDSKSIDLWKAKLDEFCWTTPPAAIIAAVAIVVIFLLGIVVIFLLNICFVLAIYTCYRETIVIWIYSKSWARIFFVEDVLDREKPYDAFLSYSHQDADFVEKTLLAGLESPDNPDHKYKCLIHTRDWNIGEMIPDQIIHSVESSRRTIIILSKSYIESMWTKLEFRAAHTQALQDKTQRVIIVVRGELPTKENMEEDLLMYLNLNIYLDSEDPWFWQKLRYALPLRGNQWSKKRTRRETDKMELMRSQAELELGKESRTPSPKTLDVNNLLANSLIDLVASLDGGRPDLDCTVHSLAEKNIDEGDNDVNITERLENTSKMEPEKRTEEPNLFFSGLSEDDIEESGGDNVSKLEAGKEPEPSDLFFSGLQEGTVEKEQEATSNRMKEEQKPSMIRRKMIDWLEETKGRFQLDSNCHNLLDPYHECRLSTILPEERYLSWNSKFLGLQELFRATTMLASLELTALKVKHDIRDVKREAQGIIIRSGQKYFSKDIQKMSDSQVSGFRITSLRLQSHKAMELYGARFLPILGSNDPLIRLWGVLNYTAHGQFRNIMEIKFKVLKRMIRQGMVGLSGAQQEAVDRTLVEIAIQTAVNMVNNTPFAPFGLNQTLLCPADLISPWRVTGIHGPPKVQEIPDSGLQTLVEAKRIMTIKQDKMTELLWEETQREIERFKPGYLKLGKNKSHPNPHVTIWGVALTELGGKPPCLGVVVGTAQRDAQIRFKRGTRTVPLGQCIPITSSGNMSSGTRIASSDDMDNKEEGNRVNWIGFEIMALIVGISILYKCAMEGKSWYQKRKQSEAETKQRECEEMEETIRLMVHVLMQEKETTRKHGEPEETKYDEPILATYERWDALTDRMNDMGLLTTC